VDEPVFVGLSTAKPLSFLLSMMFASERKYSLCPPFRSGELGYILEDRVYRNYLEFFCVGYKFLLSQPFAFITMDSWIIYLMF
jgi:hypothetical protein